MTQPHVDDTASTSAAPQVERPRSRGLVLAVVAVVIVAVALVGWHAWAQSAYEKSFSSSATLEQRTAAAALAARLVPFDAGYTTRAKVMAGWLQGKKLLDAGDYNGAINALGAVYVLDVGDKELLALYTKAQDVQRIQTNWKAHAQHGHELPGGVLLPEDILK